MCVDGLSMAYPKSAFCLAFLTRRHITMLVCRYVTCMLTCYLTALETRTSQCQGDTGAALIFSYSLGIIATHRHVGT